MKDLNINLVTPNLIEGKVESSLQHIDTDDHFLNIAPVSQTLRATKIKMSKMRVSETEKLLLSKGHS